MKVGPPKSVERGLVIKALTAIPHPEMDVEILGPRTPGILYIVYILIYRPPNR